MILSWMLSALLFGVFVAVAAAAGERLARAADLSTRWIWCGALVIVAVWPLCAPLAARAFPRLSAAAATLPPVSAIHDGSALVARGPSSVIAVTSQMLLGLWTLASLLLATRLVRSLRAVRRLRDRAEHGLVDGVPVFLTEGIGPATVGLRTPIVLVPRAVLQLEEPLRRLVLCHEREHCLARDPQLLLVSAAVVALFPWNPALWLIARRLRLALETDCDARVLASGAEPLSYGRLLLMVAQHRDAIPLALTLADSASHLERRISAMQARLAPARPLHLVLAAATLVIALVGACSSGAPDAPSAQPTGAPAPRPAALNAGAPLFEFQVEQPARQLPGTGTLRYPREMRIANREGEVMAQFVVDAQGVVDVSTFKALKSTDPAFTEAVRTALPSLRFHPALVRGKPVKQLVQQPFTFGLQATR